MKKTDTDLILDSIKGLIALLKDIFATICLSFKNTDVKNQGAARKLPENFRGKIELIPENCIGCETCEKLCPALNALIFENTKNGKRLTAVDFSRCTFCGNCAYNCPKGVINMTKQYKLATKDKKDLKLNTEAEWKP